jgi:hypothetical protein
MIVLSGRIDIEIRRPRLFGRVDFVLTDAPGLQLVEAFSYFGRRVAFRYDNKCNRRQKWRSYWANGEWRSCYYGCLTLWPCTLSRLRLHCAKSDGRAISFVTAASLLKLNYLLPRMRNAEMTRTCVNYAADNEANARMITWEANDAS